MGVGTIYETLSKKEKRLGGGCKDVFVYDIIEPGLRFQLFRIWQEFFGSAWESYGSSTKENIFYAELQRRVEVEITKGKLPESEHWALFRLERLFLNFKDHSLALDFIYLVVQYIGECWNRQDSVRRRYEAKTTAGEAIEDMNARFLEHCVGYVVIGGSKAELIRRDNEHLHEELVIPALQLLYDEAFKGADAEYRSAHQHYRHGRYRECLADCESAFESTMKTIIARRNWPMPEKRTAGLLINVCLENGLLPVFIDSHLATIRNGLTNGAPTVRNNMGPHGQGEAVKEVPARFAEFMLHEVATIIVLMVEALKDLPPLV